jgi:hypothetical protein
VVVGVVEEVLPLGRGEGARKLQEIPGIGSSGKSSPGRGGRQRRSAEIREGEAGSGGRRRWSGCGEWRGGSSARESGRRGVKNLVSDGAARGGMCSAAARPGGEKGRGEGVPGMGVPCGAQELMGFGPDRRAALAAARARTFGRRQSGRETPDMWAGTVTGGGVGLSAARGEHGCGRESASARGLAQEEKEIGPSDCTVPFWNCLNYFE